MKKYDIFFLSKQIKKVKIKEDYFMIKNVNKNAKRMIKDVIEKQARISANSTTCVALYQPKAPAALKKFSKVENDK